MKKFILLLAFWGFIATLTAQVAFNISGTVTTPNGTPVIGQQICVQSVPNSTNPFNICVYTNNAGYYFVSIPNGGNMGSNQTFIVSMVNCDSTLITHTVQNNQGTTTSAIVNFIYCAQGPSCNANFTYQISGLTVAFTSLMPNSLVSYHWDFGNGQTSNLPNPIHTYVTAGTYNVCLIVFNSSCVDTICQTIVVGSTSGCNVTFSHSPVTGSINNIQFVGTVTPAVSSSIWHWNFGDGNVYTGGSNPTHLYANAGVYYVCATVTQSNNTTCSFCDTIVIGNSSSCNANFTYQASGLNVAFHSLMQNTTITYSWDFGDGITSNAINPTHVYAAAGSYNVCLSIFDPLTGCTDTVCQNIMVTAPVGCNVTFVHNALNLLPNQVQFIGTVTPNITGSVWIWNFGDGTTITGGHNVTHQYAQSGTYYVCVQVNQGSSVNCSFCDTIIVGNNSNCQASFNYQINPNGVYQFIGQFLPVTSATQWYWNFGDSTYSNLQNPSHTFPAPGVYNVCLTVSSTTCPPITVCQTVVVQASNIGCNAHFMYQQNGSTVHFFTNNSGTPVSPNMNYYWDFGNGSSSTLINPIHTYTVPGTYTVCLTVVDSILGCSNQFCQIVVIGGNTNNCQANFTYAFLPSNSIAFFGSFYPMNSSVQWHWDFGDSTYSNVQNPVHNFAAPGTYNVCLTVITASSICPPVTYCQTITIQGTTPNNCNAYFTYLANNATIHFHSIMSGTISSNITYAWNFGDGNVSNLPHPVHTYLSYGYYHVCLTVIDSLNNCQDTFCDTILIGNNSGFGGQIWAGSNAADLGTVYLLSVTPGTVNGIVPIASTPILPGGNYVFQNIPYGQYLVQAHLAPASNYFFNYLPTYYGDVLYWSQATYITVGPNTQGLSYDINLIGSFFLSNGSGFIGGNVSIGIGNKSTTDIDNVLIVLLDAMNEPILYTYSDANGYFKFENLPFNTYAVYAEVWGKEPIPATIVLDNNNSTVDNVLIVINDLNVISSINNLYNVYFENINNLYPNPAADYFVLEFAMKQNIDIEVVMCNILGVEISREKYNAVSGLNRIQINTSDYAKGLYNLSLLVDGKIVAVKKVGIIR